jgi:predicted nucleic acid-binding protein
MIILDTNVVSEPSQARPSAIVLEWFAAQDASELFTTAATEAELYYGLALMPAGRRRDELEKALGRFLTVALQERILPFDRAAAAEFGTIAATRRKAGLQIKVFDTQIAAIARAHRAAVATRDTADFEHSGIEIINPWAT